jgi:multidrug efflux pump subunit AcrA (membrane-fusion protein)
MQFKPMSTIKRHKLAFFILLIIITGGGYYYYQSQNKSTGVTQYQLGTVEKGSIISTVSGSGQVSASTQIDVKPKISADIKTIKVKAGQKVKTGAVLAELDTSDLADKVKEAQNSLDVARVNLSVKLEGATVSEIKTAKNAIATAKLAYDNTKINLENTKKTNEDSLKKAEMSLQSAQLSYANAQLSYNNSKSSNELATEDISQELLNTYESAKSTLNSASIAMHSALLAADNVLGIDRTPNNTDLKFVLGVTNSQNLTNAQSAYTDAKNSLSTFDSVYSQTSVSWQQSDVDNLLNQAKITAEKIKTLEHNTYYALLSSMTSSGVSQTSLDSYKSTISAQETAMISQGNTIQTTIQNIYNSRHGISTTNLSTTSSLNSAKSSVETASNSLTTAQMNLEETKLSNKKSQQTAESDIIAKKLALESAQDAYSDKIAPLRAIDVATLRLSLSQAQSNYAQAVDDLKSAKVVSPIDGIVADVLQSVGDAAAPASGIMTVITQKQIATVSLSEVDAVKVKTSQKVLMTFSAIDGLEITGEVVEVDSLGTVSQGVVTYGVKIVLDTEDSRVKSQMSVSAVITTDKKLDILLVPSSAIKTDNSGLSYVEVLPESAQSANSGTITSAAVPEKKYIQTGLSDDTNTEITSGLSEGDKIIVKTTTASQTAAKTTQQSGLQMFGGGGGVRR